MASPSTTRHTQRVPSLTLAARGDTHHPRDTRSPVTPPVRFAPLSSAPVISSEDVDTLPPSAPATPQEPVFYTTHKSPTMDYAVPTSHTKSSHYRRTLGNWQLGKTIGQGSMGRVRLARNLFTGEQVSHIYSAIWTTSLLLLGRC